MNQRLVEARKARGWTQAELARVVGVSRPSITLYEGGLIPPLRVAHALALALDTTVDHLFSPLQVNADNVGVIERRKSLKPSGASAKPRAGPKPNSADRPESVNG